MEFPEKFEPTHVGCHGLQKGKIRIPKSEVLKQVRNPMAEQAAASSGSGTADDADERGFCCKNTQEAQSKALVS